VHLFAEYVIAYFAYIAPLHATQVQNLGEAMFQLILILALEGSE
jgi:hypothetical protein